MLARIVTADWVSAAIIVATLPLIPVFMVLIGWATQSRTDRQWRLLSRLSGHFLDVVAGLPTLKVFGRAKAQAEIDPRHHRRLPPGHPARRCGSRSCPRSPWNCWRRSRSPWSRSSIGLRLVHGDLDLHTGLLVLVLAPEAYLPLRQVGAQYHAAAEGLAAAEQVFEVLETPGAGARLGQRWTSADGRMRRWKGSPYGTRGAPDTHSRRRTCVAAPRRDGGPHRPQRRRQVDAARGAAGLRTPTQGRVLVGGIRRSPRWTSPPGTSRSPGCPSSRYLFAGTIAENVRLARPDADDGAVVRALADAGALDLALRRWRWSARTAPGCPRGSASRVALARAFLADRRCSSCWTSRRPRWTVRRRPPS